MLISMVDNPTPSRPEITDTANAIFDGTDAVMLSNETAVGKYPLKSVQVMQRIIHTTEKSPMFREFIDEQESKVERNSSGAVGFSACETARTIKAKAIFCATELGRTAKLISTHRPEAPIFALTMQNQTMKYLNFVWGVIPFEIQQIADSEKIFQLGAEIGRDLELGQKGDSVVITSGSKPGITGGTNLIKIQEL
jgi:pyruvate kinase